MSDAPCPAPETVPFWQSKRLWSLGFMVVARVLPALFPHVPAIKDICDWILNGALTTGFYFTATSNRTITASNPPTIGPLAPQP